jgi:hypothetical protein
MFKINLPEDPGPAWITEEIPGDEFATDLEIERARDEYGTEDIEIDGNAKASRAEDGVWVAAWVWLANN